MHLMLGSASRCRGARGELPRIALEFRSPTQTPLNPERKFTAEG